MTMDELKSKLLNKEFTHITITNLIKVPKTKNKVTDGDSITRRIIKVDNEGCWSIHQLNREVKVYRKLPIDNFKMIDGQYGYMEQVISTVRPTQLVRVEFKTIKKEY